MKLLLVEDDRRAAGFVARGLNEAGYQVEHASEGHEGLEMALTRDYAAAVVDLMLPGLDGMSLIAEVRGRDIPLPIIILSAKGELNDRIKGLETGADDYLTKPFAFAELLARLQALLRRSSGQNEPTRLSIADLSLDLVSRNVSRGESPIDLQPKEFALLEYLMRNAGRVVSKTMIMEHVWDYNFDPQTNVVEARVCRLRAKVDLKDQAKLIHTVRGVGYVLKAD
jgi:two-component system OmpR family response regulator